MGCRSKQYGYYRDKLLSEEYLLARGKVEWRKLGEVCCLVTAHYKLKRNEYKVVGSVPIIDQGESFISGYTDEILNAVPKDCYIIFGDHSEHIKYVDFKFVQGADGIKILKPLKDNAKFIYYAFCNFYIKGLGYKRHWSQAKETIIPIPPLEVQEEIVRILDKFDTLTTSISEGLPREIELRRKQYEYYREQLLNFTIN